MPAAERYYNEFYEEVCRLDAVRSDYSKIADLLMDEVSDGRPIRIADLGCGYGSVSSSLATQGYEVYGVDLGERALRTLSTKHIRAIKGDIAERLPIADSSMDVVLLLDVLEHVFDPVSVLSEARRILCGNGVLVLAVPLYFDILDRIRILLTGSVVSYDNLAYGREVASRFRSYNYDHIRFFRPGDVDEMLTVAGFRPERRVFSPLPSPGLLTPGRGALRFLARRIPGLFAHAVRVKARKT